MKCEDCKKQVEENKEKSYEEIFFENYSDEKYCMEAVKGNGDSLRYVKEQKIFKKILDERTSKNKK